MIYYKCDMCLSDHYDIGEMDIVTIKYAGKAHVNYPRDGVFHICNKCTGKLLNSLHAFRDAEFKGDKG